MLKLLILPLALSAAALTACGEDAEVESAPTFCAEFTSPTATTGSGFGTQAEVGQAATFFRQLQQTAPEEISPRVETVADGLESMVEAFADIEEGGGVQTIEGVQEAAGVDLDEISRAAEDVREYAAENCEEVEPAE